MAMLASLCECLLGPRHRGRARAEYASRGDDSVGQDLAGADNPEYLTTLISLCSFGDTNQKAGSWRASQPSQHGQLQLTRTAVQPAMQEAAGPAPAGACM